ncbi:hypothetical protein [Virgisporangium aliadipatigenens]|uniref:hypothetical protein n=1 Tax=Virgisporangium aliadipatigenens TaxID=741659 RepID=UPI001940E7E2|nr:hypothetical protein [Virgisporangium aliadipatigenens]
MVAAAENCLDLLFNGSRGAFEAAERVFIAASRKDLGIPTQAASDTDLTPHSGWPIRMSQEMADSSTPEIRSVGVIVPASFQAAYRHDSNVFRPTDGIGPISIIRRVFRSRG